MDVYNLGYQLSKHSGDRRAVIIRGNPDRRSPPKSGTLYAELQKYLEGQGFSVDFDEGKPHTVPEGEYDAWIGHSRGADRLRFAPAGTTTVSLGSSLPGSINHPSDVQDYTSEEYDELSDELRQAHMDWHPSMANQLGELLGKKIIPQPTDKTGI